MTPHQTLADIKGVMSRMIRATLSDEQHYPVLASKGGNIVEINIAGAPDLSASMKSRPYNEIYADLVSAKAFNLKLVDGALI